MRKLAWGVLLSVGLLSAAPAQQSTTRSSVETLIEQLAADEGATRDAAQQALLDLQGDVVALLTEARKSATDPDVQLRLDTLIVQIQERIDVGPSRITLRYMNAPLNEVLDELGRQSRATFSDLTADFGNLESVPRISIDVSDVSFWKALETIQAAAPVVFMPQPDGWRAMRNFGQISQVRGSECGAFLIQPQVASYQRTISYARDANISGEHFTLQFQVMVEPKIKLAASAGMLQVDRAVDSQGNDLLAAQRTQQIGSGGQNVISCVVMLRYPKEPGEKIAEVSGSMRLFMARRIEALSSDDIVSRSVQGTIDGQRVTIEAEPLEGAQQGQLSIRIFVDRGDGDVGLPLANRIQQTVNSQLRITDVRNMPLRLTQGANLVSQENSNRFEIRLAMGPSQPQASAGPYKLKFEVPTSFREVEVPFSFGDLKMP